jgi:hypothetical protein
MSLAQVWPAARHKVNAQQVVDEYADQLGVSPNLVRSDEDADAMTQAEAQAAQQAQQAEQLKATAQSTKALGDTSMEGDTALNRLLEGVAG